MIDFDPKWRTSTVTAICERIRDTRDCPILADACEDAGCDDGPLLRLLRTADLDELAARKLVAMIQSDELAASVRWLENYANRVNSYDEPDKAFARLIEGLETKEIYAHGTDLHGLYELDYQDELEENARRFLGIDIKLGEFSFSCSC